MVYARRFGGSCFRRNPVRDFHARVFGEVEKTQACFGLRLTEPGYLRRGYNFFSGFWRLDAQVHARKVDEGIECLEREAILAQVEYHAAVVGTDFQISQ